MANFIQGILDLGAHIFLPLVMIILGLIIRMKFSKAFSAALTLGVAFLGMGMVISFMMGSIGPAASAFVENTGIELTSLDMGWSPVAAIAWTWKFAFFMFPLQIAINLIMLALGWTSCLNVDLWNVWNKVLTGFIVTEVSGSVTAGFVVAAIQVVLELKNADLTQKQIYKMTKIPGIACPHSMVLSAVLLYPFKKALDKILPSKATINATKIKQKIGIFGENHVMGFIVGCLIGIFAKYDIPSCLTLGVQAGAALVIFPMVAKLFMAALAPISDAAGEFMKSRFPGKEFYIGLDWPFLAGSPELWVTCILLVPITLAMAVILPGNTTLPFGGILNICFAATALVLTGGDLVKMLILGLISTPLYLYVATSFAPMITDLAVRTGAAEVPAGQMLTWNGLEMPGLRYIFAHAAAFEPLGLGLLALSGAIYFWYYKGMSKKEKEVAEELGLKTA